MRRIILSLAGLVGGAVAGTVAAWVCLNIAGWILITYYGFSPNDSIFDRDESAANLFLNIWIGLVISGALLGLSLVTRSSRRAKRGN
jgi:hypothetical protein